MNESSLAPTNAAPQPPLSHGSWRRVARRGKHAALQHLLGRDAPTHPLALSRTRQAPTKSEGQRLRRGNLIGIGFGAKESQFFAPKISRVEAPPPAIPSAFGWRKLVRFKAKAESAADANGMELLSVLQNVFETSPTGNPLDADRNVSLFNRVIATRKVGLGPYSQSKRALYFFADGPRVKCDQAGTPVTCAGGNVPSKVGGQFQDDGAIGFSLKATSDIRNPETEQEDFTALHQLEALSPPHHGILYDGGPALGAPQFKKAFDIIRRKWLELHNSVAVGAARHGLPQQRGFGLQLWAPASERDCILLYDLDRYCYRGHSSINYYVCERQEVLKRKDDLEAHHTALQDATVWMPQDRMFPGTTPRKSSRPIRSYARNCMQPPNSAFPSPMWRLMSKGIFRIVVKWSGLSRLSRRRESRSMSWCSSMGGFIVRGQTMGNVVEIQTHVPL